LGRRRLELRSFYSSPSIIRLTRLRSMRWAWHVACMGEECVKGIGGKARRKEITRKAETYVSRLH
jgi:hypothetical protein